MELDAVQFVLINRLCIEDVDIDEPEFVVFIQGEGMAVEEFVASLISTRLVALNGKTLELLTTECACAILPDGRRIAAENNTGRLKRWLDAYHKARRAAPAPA
ncbi:MAG: hypothetical protein PSV23_12125 [Brevundimonas sp.]|uniref:hypothetical protein n=1 Tax=Brevundimonas sp. TaxID=1871086 RepID=UPI00248A4D5F|nr:hypothetical protein [Brevundimonas sp.]MDI1327530.1 hypothetical protein [Brevundimonas sp.]